MLRVLETIVFGFLAIASSAIPDKIGIGKLASRDTSSSYSSSSYTVTTLFESSDCSDTPVLVVPSSGCYLDSFSDSCILRDFYDANSSLLNEVPYSQYQESCASDLKTFADDAFRDQVYLRLDFYNDEDCTEINRPNIVKADDECHSLIQVGSNYEATSVSFRVTVNSNATISYEFFSDATDCSGTPTTLILATNELLSSNACSGYIKMYINLDVNGDGDGISVFSATGGGGLSTGAIAGIVVGCFGFVVIVVGFFMWRRRVRSRNAQAKEMMEEVTTPDRSSNA